MTPNDMGMGTPDLLDIGAASRKQRLGPRAMVLGGFALPYGEPHPLLGSRRINFTFRKAG